MMLAFDPSSSFTPPKLRKRVKLTAIEQELDEEGLYSKKEPTVVPRRKEALAQDASVNFRFRCKIEENYCFDQCAIKTCKNWSPILSSGCMLVERTALNSDKGMTDHEIRFFKGYDDVKTVTKQKKAATDAVYAMIILDKYIDFCRGLPARTFAKAALKSKKVKRITRSYPLNFSGFDLSLATLSYVVDKNSYEKFRLKSGCETCEGFELVDLLDQTQDDLDKLVNLFKLMEK